MSANTISDNVLYPDLSYRLNGIFYEVQNKLGRNRSERSYGDLIEEKCKKSNITYVREHPIAPSFEGEAERRNIADFIVEKKIVVELKVCRIIKKEHYFQVRRYLEASGLELGIIVNFRQKYLHPKRVLYDHKR